MTPVLTLCAAAIDWVAKGAIPVHGESHIGMSGVAKFVSTRALRRVNMKNHGRGNNGTYIGLEGGDHRGHPAGMKVSQCRQIKLLFTHRARAMRLGCQVSQFSHRYGGGRCECNVIWDIETWMTGTVTWEVFTCRYYVLLGPLWQQNR